MDVMATALAGFQAASGRLDAVAERIARASSVEASYNADAPVVVDTVDIAGAIVEMTAARNDVAVNVKALEAQKEVDRMALDLFA
jgi:hypothetical protein